MRQVRGPPVGRPAPRLLSTAPRAPPRPRASHSPLQVSLLLVSSPESAARVETGRSATRRAALGCTAGNTTAQPRCPLPGAWPTSSACRACTCWSRKVPSSTEPTMVRPLPALSCEVKDSRRGCFTHCSAFRFTSTSTCGLPGRGAGSCHHGDSPPLSRQVSCVRPPPGPRAPGSLPGSGLSVQLGLGFCRGSLPSLLPEARRLSMPSLHGRPPAGAARRPRPPPPPMHDQRALRPELTSPG